MQGTDEFGFNYVHCDGFTMCGGQRPPYTVLSHPNVGDRVENQFVFPYEGTATIYADGVAPLLLNTGFLNDVSNFAGKAMSVHFSSEGGRWISLNPNPASKRFNAVLLKDGQETTITATDKQCIVFSLQGVALCNAVEIPEMQYATITEGRVVTVKAQPNAIVAIFTER